MAEPIYKKPKLHGVSSGKWMLFAEDNVEISNTELLGTSYFGFGSSIRGGMVRSYVEVGRYTRIGRGVSLGLGNHDYNNTSVAPFFGFPPSGRGRSFASSEPKRRVIIGSDVWIGDGVRINTGVTVGHGAIIGAAALVTKDVPPYSIVGGIPAKHLKWRFEEDVRKELLNLQWWNYAPDYLHQTLKADPRGSIDALRATIKEAPKFDRPKHRVSSAEMQ